jgi:lipase maturation factor 1
LTRLLGNQTFRVTETLFLKLLAIVYLFAFGSLWPQIVGLVGANGLAPAAETMLSLHADYGRRAYWDVPSLFWLAPHDWMLKALCALGCAAALLLLGGIFVRTAALAAYVFYLSLVTIGQPFTGFQWDALLLETGFLAIFAGSSLLPLAYRLLLFRLMFESGLVKITSHDANWRNLHALRFHFYTQPLPMPLAYYMQQAPDWLLDSMTLSVFAIELLVPFFLFPFSRRVRQIAVALLVGLQLVIALTGNYTFFNLLTIALCLWGLDDECFRPFKNWRTAKPLIFVRVANILVGGLGILGVLQIFGLTPSLLYSFELSNSYGLFAMMTTSRTELIVEGSDDGISWRDYSFHYKPGDVKRSLPIIAPLQPRLDWQMWFAALGSPRDNPWLRTMVYRLLSGQTEVLGLLEPSSFKIPPRTIRIQAYSYTFTTRQQRQDNGSVWQRTLLGTWLEPVSLRANNY